MKLRGIVAGALALGIALFSSVAMAQVNPGTSPLTGAKGGTNNAFMQFTGPSTSLKTFTLPNVSGTIAMLNQAQNFTSAQVITSNSSAALAVGTNGATNPAFQIDSSVASQAAGVSITGAVTAGTVKIDAIDSGANTNLTLNAKGAGVVTIGNTSGGVTLTPAVTLGSTINKVTVTAPASAATLTIANNKTLTANNSLTLSGTDATTMTFPTTSATIARTDAAQSFTGVQTFVAPILGTPTSVNLSNATALPTTALTGTVSLASGGTASNLSATGGASQVLKQTSVGGAVTVGQLASADISDMPTAWGTFTPSFTCGTATITNNSARAKVWGKTTHIEVDLTITAIGTCTVGITFTLPNIANSGGGLVGRDFATSSKGFMCDVRAGSGTATCTFADFSNFAVNAHLVASGVYENQ